ncbi:MAG TPA: methyltransferase domain-containing protein [Gaiellaceae bacterium]|nr:methyltransferase domain-containing protein [Gaiellaceae bacterium]
MLKEAVRRGIVVVADATPNKVMRQLFRAWLLRIERWPDPRAAMRELPEVDTELEYACDAVAIRYDQGVHAKHRLTGYHDFFVERIRPGERVLDLGCGKAELAADIVRRADARVTGVDLNVAYLAFARDWMVPLRLELGLPHFSDPTHEVEYDLDGFEAEMRAAGLRVASAEVSWGEIWAEVRR